MIKKIVLSVFVIAIVGCGDESKETSKAEAVSTDKAPIIEIVANENAKEIKVEQKDGNGSGESTFYQGMTSDLKHGYDPNSQPANKDASVRVRPRTEVDANMHIRSPYEQVQVSLIVDGLSKNFRVKCSACHSDYANGVIGPSLLGKNSDEIFNAIADFKSGKKSNPLMDGLIDHMEDSEIRGLADEIYKFNQKIKEMRSK
jgi:cytochrome c553